MRLDPRIVKQQIDNLLLQYPELAEDDQLRADMVEGETDTHEFLRVVERKRQEAKAYVAGIETNINELEQRQNRFGRREQAMRALAFRILEASNLKKLEIPECTMSITNGQQHVMGDPDPDKLPDDLVRIKREVNRAAIKERLKAGLSVQGCSLSNAEPHLTIRTR